MEKVKNIKYIMYYPTNFFHNVCENNGLLNKNYWDDLAIIDQGHSKGSILQFCLYIGYPWTNFNKMLTKIMALWPETKKNKEEHLP